MRKYVDIILKTRYNYYARFLSKTFIKSCRFNPAWYQDLKISRLRKKLRLRLLPFLLLNLIKYYIIYEERRNNKIG
jgi:hypothetical protein